MSGGSIDMHSRTNAFAAILTLTALLFGCGPCTAAVWPTIQSYPKVNAACVVTTNSYTYTVSTTISDGDGYADIVDVRVLFGFMESGGDKTKGRGYLAWGLGDANITRYGGNWVLDNAAGAGGGRWGYMSDDWGGTTYITPVTCTNSVSGLASGGTGTRSVSWTFKAKPAWTANPLVNDADVRAMDAAGNTIGWRDNPNNEFFTVGSYLISNCATPRAPTLGNPTTTTLDVAIASADSATNLFCIRVSPAVLGKEYVQADGSLGPNSFGQTRAAWGTKTVTGLQTDTTYSFKVIASSAGPNIWPSAWGPSTSGTTTVATYAIDYARPGIAINKGVHGMDAQPKVLNAQHKADTLAASWNTSMRWGGDGYNWKTCTAQWNSSSQTTLSKLREARDRNSYLQILTNTRGIGTGNGSTWVYTDQTAETLAALTADWVFYCNEIVQNRRQGDTLTEREQAVLDSLSWGTSDKLLAPGETPVPRVEYWEIGNEPEGPYPPPSLTPADYAARYKTISEAVIAEDATVKVGPGCMTADNGNAWLDAVDSDPTSRVDFVNYHPYGNLYGITKTTSGGILIADDLCSGLNTMKQAQYDKHQKMVDRLVANSRPADTPLAITECNPSSWEGTYYFQLCRTAAHGLGVAETIFAFTELGILASQYWDLPNNGGSATIELPGFKVYKALQAYMGDRLLDSYNEPDFRIYTTLDSRTGRLVLWVLNFSEYRDKSMRFQIPAAGSSCTMTQRRLAAVSGSTSLLTKNNSSDPSENVRWTVTDLSNTVDPADFTPAFPRASLTMLIIDRPMMSLPDGTRTTLEVRCVTAAHPSDGYIYVEQSDRTYGIRVSGDCSAISVGDLVNITGSIGTRKPDGSTSAERMISADAITRISAGGAIKPLGIACRSVGGGPANGTAGVDGAYGLNNVGLLVRIAGVVTEVADAERMHVSDGSVGPDPDGKTGVLVRCPNTAPFSVGDMVTVTGVVEGDVPSGWTANRRFLRARTTDDIVRVLQ